MTREEIMELDLEGIEARKAEMRTEVEQAADSAALDALEAEKAIIEERVAQIRADIETRKADMAEVMNGKGEEIEKPVEERTMTDLEVRNSEEYINAYAKYLKTGKDDECRALLSKNAPANGQVPVPTYVDELVKTAWDRLELMGLVRKTFIPGNLNVGFELSADPAYVHTEGSAANTEEALTLGIVELKPESLKKWITLSDEAIDLSGRALIDYIYDELTYRIAKLAQEKLIGKITACTASATSTAVGVGVVKGTPSVGVIAEAIGKLSDEAANPVIVMNKGTWAQFKAAQYAGNFNVDPFEGCRVFYDNTLPTYSTTGTANAAWAIVGDFGVGAQANFPAGDEITIKYDDLSLAEKDLVKFVGREYVALGAVADKAFTKIVF
jgi:Chromosome segregation ATPases